MRRTMNVRFATEADLDRVNELRKQVNDLHVKGKPEIFKPGFPQELRDHIYTIRDDPKQRIVVAERDGVLCGFAVLNHVVRPENPFMSERNYLDIDEFCVDEAYRRQGVGTALIDFARAYAKEQGLERVELNVWEFNKDALAFYEAAGFQTYRRYMELPTEREAGLKLIKFTENDRTLYESLVFNEDVMRQNYGRTFTAEEAKMLFSAMLEANAEPGPLGFYRADVGGDFAGMGALTQNETGALEIEYALLPQFWRQRYGTALAATLVRMAAESGRSETVEAITDPGNLPSKRILIKAGFTLAKQYENDDGEPVELYRKTV